MLVKYVMTGSVEVIRPDTSLKEAAAKMRDLAVGSLPICSDGRLLGLLTDRDITVRATAEGCDPTTSHVSEIMSPELAFCFEDQPAEEAAEVMKEHQVRRLPVLDQTGKLVGVVSLGDLALGTRDTASVGETLQEVSLPGRPNR
jgi:CBS domain-containing protein